jgi:cytochrome c biogenesis protein ResB
VDVTQDSKPVLSAYPIQVNHPLSLGFLNVYQSTYGTEALVQLQGADGKLTSAAVGQSLTVGESELVLAGTQKTEEGLAVRVEEWKNQQKVWIVNGTIEKADANFLGGLFFDKVGDTNVFIGTYPLREDDVHKMKEAGITGIMNL